ncbi:MAG: indole-3-glycerol phosphate synthase TrpC [Gemmatimonadales bacterium]
MSDFLREVLEVKRAEVAELYRSGARGSHKRQALTMPLPPSFHDALRVPPRRFAVIGEIKRASPSAGDIRPDLDAGERAKLYESLGLAAVSVLTDEHWFKGRPEDMLAAAQATTRPVLCKDFIIDPVQIERARAYGASAVLLICALLDDDALRTLIRTARRLSLDPLVEVHDSRELSRALDVDARIIGVNARDLRTLEVDLNVPRRLVHRLPEWTIKIAESGLRDHDTLVELSEAGFDAFLIGEYLSSADDPASAVDALMGEDLAD